MSSFDVHDDLRRRMVPSAEACAAALELLEANPGVDGAYTPIAFPGKEYGFWTFGQPVVDVATAFPNSFDGRNDAVTAAARLLGEQPGTVGYVMHHRGVDGSVDGWAVFEEILSPMRLLHFVEQDARR